MDYEKLATVVLRGLAYYLLLFAVIEWGIIGAGALLMQFGLYSRGSIALEARLLSSIFYLIGGLVLLLRSRSLAERMVEDLNDAGS